ncbi:MAG TPA: signal peptidase I [Steroidobacteraceae bacterium]|nr:signal peptidase I [Steroidobacteraceae bacterium]
MKARDVVNILTLVLAVLLLGGEATLWAVNPLHVPAKFLPARALGLQLFRAQGAAMDPTVSAGQRVLISAWSYWLDPPRAGDIVAFAYPGDPGIADLKRIIAVGGSTIAIKDGAVYVDGTRQDEPYLHAADGSPGSSMRAFRVPPDSFFVMGDYREQSEDSRNYGSITRASIIGKRW